MVGFSSRYWHLFFYKWSTVARKYNYYWILHRVWLIFLLNLTMQFVYLFSNSPLLWYFSLLYSNFFIQISISIVISPKTRITWFHFWFICSISLSRPFISWIRIESLPSFLDWTIIIFCIALVPHFNYCTVSPILVLEYFLQLFYIYSTAFLLWQHMPTPLGHNLIF